ncbi:MAG: NAD(P)-dependent alcohol dehydrogenase [Rhodospirillaceae bacterium]|nr:NAD(P)-dependent alcohol dehydrogenase [Rhodospirillaceae bacterium]
MAYSATAAVVREPGGPFSLERVELDALRDNEVLVRVRACGICHTDAKFQSRVPLPGVFGHEGAGVVEETGAAVTSVRVGDQVIISYPWCGACPSCKRSEPFRCENILALKFAGRRSDGSRTVRLNGHDVSSAFFQQSSFATHAIALAHALVPVQGSWAPEMLAALPCGVQTGAGAVFNTFGMGPGHSLVVFGVGPVGLSAIMAARAVGVSPRIAVDINPSRLERALELGATHALDASRDDVPRRVREWLPRGVSHALESSITASALTDAIKCLGQGGKVGIFSAPPPGEEFPFSTRDLFERVGSLHGIVQGSAVPGEFLPRLMELQRAGRFPYERLISTYDFAGINSAFADLEEGTAIKPVLVFPPG